MDDKNYLNIPFSHSSPGSLINITVLQDTVLSFLTVSYGLFYSDEMKDHIQCKQSDQDKLHNICINFAKRFK